MILGELNNPGKTDGISQEINEALSWAKEHIRDKFQPGKTELASGRITVNHEEVAMTPKEKKMLECHRRYIDIHIPLTEVEVIGWSALNNLRNLIEPYDEEKDIEFYGDTAQVHIPVYPGQFVIFFPEDAHAPNIGIGNHRKLCIKIPVG